MIHNYFFRVFYYLYIETINFLRPPQHLPPRNPTTDLSQPTAVETYLDVLLLTIPVSKEPLKLLQNSQVTCIRMVKEVGIAQHEYTLVEVHFGSDAYYFRVERTRGAQPRQTIEELKRSEDPEVAEIGNTINNLAASGSEMASCTAVPSETPSSLPLGHAEPSYVSCPTRQEFSSNTSKSTLGKPLHSADDLISRVPSLDPPSPDVTLHEIHPEDLTWLQFMIIVNIVRSEDMLYSVFGSQCYLFSHLIFLLTQAKFCPGGSEKGPVPSDESTVPVHISRQLSHPALGQKHIKLDKLKDGLAPGTWMSVSVTLVEIHLLRTLQSKFDFIWNDTHQDIERWAENAKEIEEFRKKQESQAPTGGPLSGSRSLPRTPGGPGRGMSTLPRALEFRRMRPHIGTWTRLPPNSLRAARPPAIQKRFLDHLVNIFKRK